MRNFRLTDDFKNKKPSDLQTCSGSVRPLGMVEVTGFEPGTNGVILVYIRIPTDN